MEKINIYFKMVICSLILIFFRSFYKLGGGIAPFIEIFGMPSSIDKILFKILALMSILGSILLLYSCVCFFIESFRFIRINRNK